MKPFIPSGFYHSQEHHLTNCRMMLLLIIFSSALSAFGQQIVENRQQWLNDVEIRPINAPAFVPQHSVNTMYQGADGFVWFGTTDGLFRYDGVRFRVVKNDVMNPKVLTSNDVESIVMTDSYTLWVGTDHGLNRIDARTGESHKYHFNDFGNSDKVGVLLATSDGTLMVGTEGGLYVYHADSDSFEFLFDQHGNAPVPHCAIKSLHEDERGFIWVGTWDKGVFRYSKKDAKWYALPKFNDLNSGQALYVDSNGKLWVGTWGKGIYRIDNPYDTNKPLQFENYMIHSMDGKIINSNFINSIVESKNSHRLWIGTTLGLCFCDYNNSSQTFYLLPNDKEPYPLFFANGVDNLLADHHGNIFLNAKYSGMAYALVSQHNFHGHNLFQNEADINNIRGVSHDRSGNIWVALDHDGIICLDEVTSLDITHSVLPQHVIDQIPSRMNTMYHARTGKMYFGSDQGGIIIYDPQTQATTTYNKDNASWVKDNCFYDFAEDAKGNIVAAGWHGLSVLREDGKCVCLENTECVDDSGNVTLLGDMRVRNIIIASDRTIWFTERNGAIVHLTGNILSPASLHGEIYNHPIGSEYIISDAVGIVEDRQQRIWACSKSVGIMLFDKKQNGFASMNHQLDIPNEHIYSIELASDGTIWLSTRQNLLRLTIGSDMKDHNMNFFSVMGMQNFRGFGNYLSHATKTGNVVFAGNSSYTTFDPRKLPQMQETEMLSVTGIRIYNKSLDELTNDELQEMIEALPPFTQRITLDQAHNDITIEFSTFNFASADNTRYAYKLEGYDKDWVFVEPGTNSVSFSNLPSGTYKFSLRAADPKNSWTEREDVLTIVVLPPLWLRWWAILIYIIMCVAVVVLLIRYYRNRLIQRQQLQIAQMEADKVEELNHKKLQFYTNITHDLMTPLTVISATVEQMTGEGKVVVQNNVERLMRLLQQILEFRKAETGNLRLRVANGDIADFCRREVESIQPLMQKRQLHLSLVTSPESVRGYFDSDALDKIMYNLLSNAAKYNRPKGFVQVTLEQSPSSPDFVTITVKDSGMGIAKAKQASLFDRFYEGEHRKFNTYGTGIGLSLTRDLVHLHHGEITFESVEGQGTTFTVTLPLARSKYQEEEIEQDFSIDHSDNDQKDDEGMVMADEKGKAQSNDTAVASVLIVEDNDEILSLLKSIISTKYHVLTAYNGSEALEILENDDVDLIVSDIMMPVMDGVEMLKRVRQDSRLTHTPVIMLTAKRDDQDRAEAYSIGADAYITKPFNTSVLMSRIDNLVERSNATKRELKKKDLVEMTDIDLTSADEEFLKTCIACVQRNIGNADFDQQMFADEIGTSKSTLYKKLKVMTGQNTSAFIRNIRMKTACEVLERNPSIRISELAYSLGYNDPKYFSSCFKKDFGMLPSEYVKGKEEG